MTLFWYDVILCKKWLSKSDDLTVLKLLANFYNKFFENLSVWKTLRVSTYSSNKSKRESFNLLSPSADDLEDFLVSLFSMEFLLLTSVNFK